MFYEKYLKATKEKDSFININLDPALPKQIKDNVVPNKYISKEAFEKLFDKYEHIISMLVKMQVNSKQWTI